MTTSAALVLALIWFLFAVLVGLPDAVRWVRRKVRVWRSR
jgi:hypothetical protein